MVSNLAIQELSTVSLLRPSISGRLRTRFSMCLLNTSLKSLAEKPPLWTILATRSLLRNTYIVRDNIIYCINQRTYFKLLAEMIHSRAFLSHSVNLCLHLQKKTIHLCFLTLYWKTRGIYVRPWLNMAAFCLLWNDRLTVTETGVQLYCHIIEQSNHQSWLLCRSDSHILFLASIMVKKQRLLYWNIAVQWYISPVILCTLSG